jgi:hypothetical protein
MGHSNGVRLRYITFHSLREMMPELINRTLKRRSPYYAKLNTYEYNLMIDNYQINWSNEQVHKMKYDSVATWRRFASRL